MPTCFESLIRELETAKLLIIIEYAMKETKKENKIAV